MPPPKKRKHTFWKVPSGVPCVNARRKNKDHGDMLYATERYATAFLYAFLKDDGTAKAMSSLRTRSTGFRFERGNEKSNDAARVQSKESERRLFDDSRPLVPVL
jgi:hypothetical protein